MNKLGWYIAKIKCKTMHSHEPLNKYFRRGGATIGKNSVICSNLDKCDKFVLKIGDEVTISVNVTFVTHDHSIYHIRKKWGDLWGAITIGNNCFIGENATILYGVSLADNIIVAAGAVVTKSFSKNNIIIGGNPAKIIGDWETFGNKYRDNYWNNRKELLNALNSKEPDSRLIKK